MNPFIEKRGLKAFKLWLQTKQNYLLLILGRTEGMAVGNALTKDLSAEQRRLSLSDRLLCWDGDPRTGLLPHISQPRLREEERISVCLWRVRFPMQLGNHPTFGGKKASKDANSLLIRTSPRHFSFQPLEIVWIWGATWKNGRSDTSIKNATAQEKGCWGPLPKKYQEARLLFLPTCLWASAKLKGRVPSSRGAIRSMSAKVIRLEGGK